MSPRLGGGRGGVARLLFVQGFTLHQVAAQALDQAGLRRDPDGTGRGVRYHGIHLHGGIGKKSDFAFFGVHLPHQAQNRHLFEQRNDETCRGARLSCAPLSRCRGWPQTRPDSPGYWREGHPPATAQRKEASPIALKAFAALAPAGRRAGPLWACRSWICSCKASTETDRIFDGR